MIAVVLTAAILTFSGCATPPEEAAPVAAEVPPGPDEGWEMRSAPPLPDFELTEPFVKLVDLGRLRVGMTKAEVRAIFPDPLEIELQRDDEFWVYKFAQLIFRGDYLRDWFNM